MKSYLANRLDGDASFNTHFCKRLDLDHLAA